MTLLFTAMAGQIPKKAMALLRAGIHCALLFLGEL